MVDSIRDTVDVDAAVLGGRPTMIWFIDCNDSIIQHRLASKTKSGERRLKSGSFVDQTAPIIRKSADAVVPNTGTLEDLRWKIDDTLFAILKIR